METGLKATSFSSYHSCAVFFSGLSDAHSLGCLAFRIEVVKKSPVLHLMHDDWPRWGCCVPEGQGMAAPTPSGQ